MSTRLRSAVMTLASRVTKAVFVGLLFDLAFAHAATISVSAGVDLQAVLQAANCGDEVVLQAGATFSGNFTLPYKPACGNTGADFITIRTSGLSGIPAAGNRITPASAGSVARLVANSSGPALEAEANAHHYKFIGIEITNVGGGIVTQELVVLGKRSSGGAIPFPQHPHHIIFDRCWIHEATNDTTTPDSIVTTAIRGFFIDATDVTIKESRIAGFRTFQPISQGVEASNAILLPTSALRVTVYNTYLESWFVPVFFGGSGGSSPNTASVTNPVFDVTTHTGSAIFSSVANLGVGDLVAMKTTNGRTPSTNYAHSNEPIAFQVAKVTGITGNTVSFQSWGSYDGNLSGGNPLLQNPDSPGLAQWNGYLNEDITLRRNQVVLNFASTELVYVSTGGSPTTMPRSTQTNTGYAPKGYIEVKAARNVVIDGNTFEGWESGFVVTSRNQGLYETSGGFPWFGVFNVTISNNWWKRMQNWDRIYSFPIGGPLLEDNEMSSVRSGPFTFSNNLVESGVGPILAAMGSADNVTVVHNTYPGSDIPPGNESMVFGLGAYSPNFVFKDNILSHNEYGLNCQGTPPCWPSGLQKNNVIIDNRSFASKNADGSLNGRYPNDFIVPNQAAIGWDGNYALASSSSYKGHASDGTDPGVDLSTLIAAVDWSLSAPPIKIDNPLNGATVSGLVPVSAQTSLNLSVSRVEFYVDDQLDSTSSASPYSTSVDTRGRPNGTHSFTAKALNGSALLGSSAVFVTINNADSTPPTTSITSPTGGAIVSGTLTVVASASDNVGVTKVEFLVDSIVKGTSTSGSPFSSSIDTTTLSNATHNIVAKAYDAAGNTESSAPISVTVSNADVTSPTTNVTSPSSGASVSGSISFAATAADNIGVTKVEFLVDNVVRGTSTSSPYTQTLDTTTLTNGSHSVASRAYDAAGNNGTSATVSISVNNLPKDTTPPTVTLKAQTDIRGVVNLSAAATDNVRVTKVEFYVDGKLNSTDTTAPYSASMRLPGAKGSQHSVLARAYDAAGNVGTSATVTMTKK